MHSSLDICQILFCKTLVVQCLFFFQFPRQSNRNGEAPLVAWTSNVHSPQTQTHSIQGETGDRRRPSARVRKEQNPFEKNPPLQRKKKPISKFKKKKNDDRIQNVIAASRVLYIL